jgi:hypothetical protein
MFKYILIVSVLLLSLGCKIEDGKRFVVVDWDEKVSNININSILLNKIDVVEKNTKYEQIQDSSGDITWIINGKEKNYTIFTGTQHVYERVIKYYFNGDSVEIDNSEWSY